MKKCLDKIDMTKNDINIFRICANHRSELKIERRHELTGFDFYCRNCGQHFSFDILDVDYSKMLPHISCPSCSYSLQLPRPFLNIKKKVRLSSIYGKTNSKSQSL